MAYATRNFELFDKKTGFIKSFLTQYWRQFGSRSEAETIV